MKRVTLIWLAVLSLLLGWGLQRLAQTLKINGVVPLTGRYPGGTAQNKAGYEIGVEHVDAAGGISVGGALSMQRLG